MGVQIVRKGIWKPEWLSDMARRIDYGRTFARVVKAGAGFLPRDAYNEFLRELAPSGLRFGAALYGRVRIAETGGIHDVGLLGTKMVTNAGVQYIVDAFQALSTLQMFKFHALGSGSTAEAKSDAALVFEFGAQTNPGSVRATGTLTEGTSNNIFRTVATTTFSGAVAVVEHGVFTISSCITSAALLDRTVFSVINLANGDSLQTTYELTCDAGG